MAYPTKPRGRKLGGAQWVLRGIVLAGESACPTLGRGIVARAAKVRVWSDRVRGEGTTGGRKNLSGVPGLPNCVAGDAFGLGLR